MRTRRGSTRLLSLSGSMRVRMFQCGSDEPDDLAGRGGPCDGLEEPDGIEGLVGRAAERPLAPEGGDEVAVDGAGRAGARGHPAGRTRPAPPPGSSSVARSRPSSPKYSMTKRGPGETPEIASVAGVPSARRMAAAVTRSMSGSRRLCTAPTSSATWPVVQSRASTRWSPTSARMPPPVGLRVEPPGALGAGRAWPARGGRGSPRPAAAGRWRPRPAADAPRPGWGRAGTDGRRRP